MKKNLIILALTAFTVLASFSANATEGTASQGIINVNTAGVEELVQLQGIGSSKAQAIVAYRTEHPFRSVDEMTEVKGIGPKLLDKIRPRITVDGSVAASH